ncbi:MAG: Tail-specific protease [Chlamydiae bacterium]|nr:Tail-specific protease [Chlamydiota bacterium]
MFIHSYVDNSDLSTHRRALVMIKKYIFRIFLIFAIVTANSVLLAQEELLEVNDVQQIMGEIFAQHVDKKGVSAEILVNSFQTFFDQFDPNRVYLLESEVNQFSNLNRREIENLLRQYKRNDLEKYEQLSRTIQKAIHRSREYRSVFLERQNSLFQKSSLDPAALHFDEGESKRPFAKTVKELKSRTEEQIVQFISAERQRYGDRAIIENKDKTIQTYEKFLKYKENQYLYEDETGRKLPLAEKENLFVMHTLKALSRSLDSHTTYLNRNEAYDMKIRLEKGFRGVGVVLQRKPEGIVISRLIKEGPAEKSGRIKINDRIVKINGEDVDGDSLEEFVEKLRDEAHNTVNLVLKRKFKQGSSENEKTISVALTRELIAVDEGRVDVEYEPFENGIIGKITLHSFYQGANGVTSEKDLRHAIKDLQKNGQIRGLILDLRENSGGFLNQAVKVAGLFITNGVVVISKYSNGEQRFYRDMDGKVSFDGPLIVLTSKATASAAEIVAQALQDYGVAIVVGDEQTYGKGTIQSQTVTDSNTLSHFKVTVGKYYTVSGKTPQVRGVKADVVVPSLYANELIGEEYSEHPLDTDTINSAFKDKLMDVDPGLKPWYLRYYMPSLQEKETSWKVALPQLKQNSEKRLADSEDFKSLLNGDREVHLFENPDESPKLKDIQMEESVKILKDMIQFEKRGRIRSNVADY